MGLAGLSWCKVARAHSTALSSMRPPAAEVQKTMSWLRNKSGMKLKTGILHGKRVDYFKGMSLRRLPMFERVIDSVFLPLWPPRQICSESPHLACLLKAQECPQGGK